MAGMDHQIEDVDPNEFLGGEPDEPSGEEGGETSPETVERGHIRSYVLRQARLTGAQARAYDEHGARYILPFGGGVLDFPALFGNGNPVVMEIGFGMGHATAEIALLNPDRNYLAVEVHKPGVGALIERLVANGIANVRILHHDAVPVLRQMVAPQSLSGVHIFFPDPWQKKRHHKRRLIQAPFLAELARVCLPGAYLYLATDWEDYAQWMVAALAAAPDWQNQYEDYSPPIPWRPQTSFERKGLDKEHAIREIYALRRQEIQ